MVCSPSKAIHVQIQVVHKSLTLVQLLAVEMIEVQITHKDFELTMRYSVYVYHSVCMCVRFLEDEVSSLWMRGKCVIRAEPEQSKY